MPNKKDKNNLHPIGTIVKLTYQSGVYGVVIGYEDLGYRQAVFNVVKWFGSHEQSSGGFLSSLLEPI
jgi:hypothetical protein